MFSVPVGLICFDRNKYKKQCSYSNAFFMPLLLTHNSHAVAHTLSFARCFLSHSLITWCLWLHIFLSSIVSLRANWNWTLFTLARIVMNTRFFFLCFISNNNYNNGFLYILARFALTLAPHAHSYISLGVSVLLEYS